MQTILGANGTIGSLLPKELSNYTNKIRLVSRNPKKVNDTDELYPADLTNPLHVEKAVEGSSVVYLMVGFAYNLKVWKANWPSLMSTTIDACVKNNSKLVFFDNVYMYDINEISHMTENSKINPPSKKGLVRKEITQMILDKIEQGKLTALIARAADFYGPNNQKSFLIELVYKNMLKGKRPLWIMDANKIHSFTYTPDAAKATAILGNTDKAFNQVWHLPTDSYKITGKQIIELFAEEMKRPSKFSVLPKWMLQLIGLFQAEMREMPEMMYQYDRDYYFDSSKFEKEFNFKPTTYRNGVKEIVLQK